MSPDFPSFAIGLATGGVIAYLVWRARGETVSLLAAQLAEARKAEAVATDRLVHAWKDGATIPPRPAEPPPPVQPLPAELQAELDQWEDSEHRVMLEAKMRADLQRGLSPVAVLMELDNLHP